MRPPLNGWPRYAPPSAASLAWCMVPERRRTSIPRQVHSMDGGSPATALLSCVGGHDRIADHARPIALDSLHTTLAAWHA
jgi:hypothetical protein